MKKVVAVGDSIIYGYPVGPENSWVNLGLKFEKWEIVNKGVPGDTTFDVIQRLEKDVITESPELVILSAGANDAFQGIPMESAVNQMISVIKHLTENNITVYVAESLLTEDDDLRNAYISEYNRRIWEHCQRLDIPVIKFNHRLLGEEGLFIDGLHPTKMGYHRMAQIFLNQFKGLPEEEKT